MKRLILDDICLKLNELNIPYMMQDEKYIRVSTTFYDVGYNVQPKKVLYELSVCVDEGSRCVSMYVKTSDEYMLASGADAVQKPSASIFRKVRHISFNGDGPGEVTVIDLGEVPNTVKNTAVKYGWKFRTALNLNKPIKKAPSAPPAQETTSVPVPEPETAEPPCAPPAAADIPELKESGNGFFKRLLKRGKYTPKH